MFVCICLIYEPWRIECFSFIHTSLKSYHFSQFKITARLSLKCCLYSDFVGTLPRIFSPFTVHRHLSPAAGPCSLCSLWVQSSSAALNVFHNVQLILAITLLKLLSQSMPLSFISIICSWWLCLPPSLPFLFRDQTLGNVLHSHLGLFSSLGY